MAAIPHASFNITGATGTQGALAPLQSYRAYIFPRGANASQDSTGTLITFDSAAIASRFSANNWIQVGTAIANIRRVTAVGGNSAAVNTAVTVSENDRVFLIGNTQPTTAGGSATYTVPNTVIRTRGDDAADIVTNSMLTSNVDGLVEFYAAPNMYDALIQDGDRGPAGYVADLEVGSVEGISALDAAYFGSTVTFSGNITGVSVVGAARFGNTVTIDGQLGVTGWATFGSSVTITGAFGVTGTAAFGATTTIVSMQTSSRPWVDPTHPTYGAKGDGSTDDTTAVQAAITAAAALNGGLGGGVLIPPGTYIVGSLTVPSGVEMCGVSPVACRLKLKSNTNADMITRSGAHGQYRSIHDLYLDGNRTGNTAGRAIYWQAGAIPTRFYNLTAVDFAGKGIVLDACDAMTIDNVYINNCGDAGLSLLDCTQVGLINVQSERSGTTQGCVWIRGGNSNFAFNLGIEQNAGGSYTTGISSTGLLLDSTIAFSMNGFYALGNGLSNCDAIGITDTTTPGRSTRTAITNATQSSYTRLIADRTVSPPQLITNGGLNSYNDGFQAYSLTLLRDATGIGWGITGSVIQRTGSGSPEGVIGASIGSIYMRTDGGANTTLYIKEVGTTSSGWAAK